MLAHQLSRATGVLTLAPSGPLSAADFAAVAAEVDPWIAEHGELRGVLIHARSFPGWGDFAAFLGHLGFVRTHVRKIRRVAIASDSAFLSIAPQIAGLFVHAEVRHFGYADCDAAADWLAAP
ncbi:MAG: STAS/SEC14 domain-containing protein [Betaproteobacteria bacterium]